MSTNGPMLAPEALNPATTAPSSSVIGMPPAPGKLASGEHATKPVAIGGGSVVMRTWCTVLGTCCVAEIHAFERARAMPPAPPRSMREAEISAPLAPTTAKPPRAPMWSALAIARSISARACRSGRSRVCTSEVLRRRKADVILGQHARGRLGALEVVEPRQLEVALERAAAEVVQQLGHEVREVLRPPHAA